MIFAERKSCFARNDRVLAKAADGKAGAVIFGYAVIFKYAVIFRCEEAD